MKHRIDGRKLGRNSSHRKAMLINMATSFLRYGHIKTTLAKAKELRRFVEPIINRAKVDSLHNKRIIMKKIKNRKVIVRLFKEIAPRYANRLGGYTRIIRLGNRKGDDSPMAFIDLVEEVLETENTNKEKPKKDKVEAKSKKTDDKEK